MSKLKISSPKKDNQDRSQSVDAKTKFYREMKAREENREKERVSEDKLRRKSSYNIISNKQNTTLNTTHRVGGLF